jgi:phenylalanyl-tRNA synthetase beta chain
VFERTEDELLHPGKAARTPAGIVGELHPTLIDGTWCGFELDLLDLFAASREPVTYRDVISYPVVRQDLAVVVDEGVEAGAIVAAARSAGGDELRDVRVFDVYRGEPIPAGKKSVAFSVAFQSPERTLTDDDALRLRTAIVAALREQFGAELRE